MTRIRLKDAHVTIEFTGNLVEGTVSQAMELRSFDRAASTPRWSDPLALDPVVTRAQHGTSPAPAC